MSPDVLVTIDQKFLRTIIFVVMVTLDRYSRNALCVCFFKYLTSDGWMGEKEEI